MAIVLQGFLGPFTGKVGGAVGGIWKGINYIKGYVIPANPNTVAQQAQRGKFAAVVAVAQALLGTLIATFWNPFAVKMSGYNYFIQQVINSCSATGLLLASTIITKGTLESASSASAPTYNTGTGELDFSWSNVISGNGLATDEMYALVVNNTDNTVLFYGSVGTTRTDSGDTVVIEAGLTATELTLYFWLARGTGSTFMVSNSLGQVCSV